MKDKIENALNESRILILGAQILIGFQYEAVFQTGFAQLSPLSRYLNLAGLGLLLIAFALLVSPAAYHRIVLKGTERRELHRYTTRTSMLALLPFAFGLGIDMYVATSRIIGSTMALTAGLIALSVALFFWYGIEMVARYERGWNHAEEGPVETLQEKRMVGEEQTPKGDQEKLTEKIKQAMIEARMVLPGAQALLGFQFITILTEAFAKLPPTLQYIHLGSLAMIALSTVLLMTPAAYHRIVEEGEDTQRFHRFAGRVVLAAMVPLAFGMCGDFLVVVRQVTGSMAVALTSSLGMLLFSYGLWFGYMIYRRSRSGRGA